MGDGGGRVERDVRLYYAFSFLHGFYVASGTTVLFQRELGLTFSQIFTVEAVYMLTFILFEVPSGALADLIGRKRTIFLGTLMIAVGAVTTGLSERFWQVLASNVAWAVGFSCISGANEAMLYDRIRDERRYGRAVARSGLAGLVGAAGAGVLGPLLFSRHFRLPYLASAVPFLLAGVVVLLFRERRRPRAFTLRKHVRTVVTGARFALGSRWVRWSSLLLALLFAASYTMASAYQPYLRHVGISLALFSVIVPALSLVQGAGELSWRRLHGRLGDAPFVFLCTLAVGGAILGMGLVPSPAGVAPLFALMFFQGAAKPFLSVYANRHIPSEERATVLSVQSMIATTAAALPLFAFGHASDRFGIDAALLGLGAALLVLGAAVAALRPRPA